MCQTLHSIKQVKYCKVEGLDYRIKVFELWLKSKVDSILLKDKTGNTCLYYDVTNLRFETNVKMDTLASGSFSFMTGEIKFEVEGNKLIVY